MAYTVDDVIDQAVERSNLNDETLFTASEVYRYISSFEQRIFLIAAQHNPDYFGREGNTASRASSTDDWDLSATPGNIAAVSKLEVESITGSVTGVSTGDEVSIVSIRNPEFAVAPRAYLRDKTLFEYSSELQDDASNFVTRLKVYYSFLPSNRTAGSDTLDIPDEYITLVVLPLARVMAVRDQRADEVGPIDQEFQLDFANFIQQVSVFDEGSVRGLDQIIASAGAGLSADGGS